MAARDLDLEKEFERLGNTSPWMASFSISGRVYGSGLDDDQDVRPPHFFRVVPNPRRILDAGFLPLFGDLVDEFGTRHDRLRVLLSDEAPDLATRINPASWIINPQHVAQSDALGNTEIRGERRADVPRGVLDEGPGLDCQDEIMPEGLEHKNHADGIFIQRMSESSIVHPVPYVVSMNRRTPASVFCGTSHDDLLHDQQVTDIQAAGLTSHLDAGGLLA